MAFHDIMEGKCYMGDTGLLVSHAFDENELLEDEVYKQILAGKLGLNEGMLYENMIAQMLVANGHRLFFYTHYNDEKRRNDIEIDFLISNNSKTKYKLYPIEVKSGTHYSTESLLRFREKYSSSIHSPLRSLWSCIVLLRLMSRSKSASGNICCPAVCLTLPTFGMQMSRPSNTFMTCSIQSSSRTL